MNKITKRILILTIVVVVVGLFAYPKVSHLFSSLDQSANSGGSAQALQVEAVEIKYQSVDDKIFSSGSVRANEEVELSAEVSGKITRIYFDEGRRVRAGELLLKINDSELQAQRNRASFRYNLAKQREDRQGRLLERGGISQEDYDATVNEVNVLEAELELIDAQIEKTEIRAPFDGIVGLKYVSEGGYITPQSRIASLQDISSVKIDFSIPERYISRVDVNDRIIFNVQGVDSSFVGIVYAIEPRIDIQTRTLQIRARSANDDQVLFPGAFANIELILQTLDDAIMVPAISIIPELGGQKVFVYRDGKVEEQRVQTGIRTSRSVQVTGGLAPGDTVLTTGLLQARPGMAVQISDLKTGTDL